ncbi:MAG TPA: helicase-exonuclease AddAB subunit AddA [Bacillales bacterium]|nr:helicase-exonuclease AddAB subunit AddA [Bacillales bacterium]
MKQVKPKPEGVFWSDEQWEAIAARGQNMLVAAAAGSGKTAVLVERIIRKITEDEIDVDRLLVATFTNAAAAEMKARIGKELEKALVEDPSSLHLRRQISLLNRAQISTIHSFCMNVLRRYYYKIGIDPAFRVVDETEAELMREEVIGELFEEEYGKENNEAFYELVDRYSGDRSDVALQMLVEKLYDFSRSHPDPDQWLDDMAYRYRVPEYVGIDDLSWARGLLENVEMQLEGLKDVLGQADQLTYQPGGPAPYQTNFSEDQLILDGLLSACRDSWSALYEVFQSVKFGKLKPVRGDEYDDEMKEQAKQLRDKVKKQVEKIGNELFKHSPERYLDDLRAMAPHVETLSGLVKAFDRRYKKAKLEKGLIDFDDSQHYCLEVLADLDLDSGERHPSDAAIDYREQFNEVLVDEYQDTNFVQEAILSFITTGDNLFMVGDVKQSVYRFRQAEPGLFLAKYKAFQKDGNGDGLRIDLAKNFRSRAEVLDGTNFLFRQIMNERIGEIDYDEDAELRLGFGEYPEASSSAPEILLIDREEDKEEESATADLKKEQLEARLIAERIQSLISSQYAVYDKDTGEMRSVQYRDIAILLRSAYSSAPIMLEEFKQRGIPAYAELSTGYFEAVEVEVMMSLLQIVDNPHQDIPLAGVLRSPIVGLSGEELAQIRIAKRKSDYYEAMRTYIQQETDELARKVEAFFAKLQSWRTRARRGSLSDLIWQIFRETGYYDFVGGMPGGRQRQANLRALYDRARQYESTSFRGLFRFLRFVERMRDRGSDFGAARALGEQEDVVRVMTIHKSKGLEYPVVFIGGLNKKFNFSDSRGAYMLDKELGFGTKYIDPKLRISYPTLSMMAMRRKSEMEMRAEEMRVLYVALTRAREKLYLVGTVKDAEKTITQWAQQAIHQGWSLPDYARATAKGYIDWIGPALLRHRDSGPLREMIGLEAPANKMANDVSTWGMSVIRADELDETEMEPQEGREDIENALKEFRPVPIESDEKEKVHERLAWTYGRLEATTHMSKQTVSEIKRQRESLTNTEGTDTSYIRKFRSPIAERPRFLQEKKLTSAERGTAMHTVMQHVDLVGPMSDAKLQDTVDRLVVNEMMTEEEAEVVDLKPLFHFFQSELGRRMLAAPRVEREVPFSLAISADQAYPDWPEMDETVLVQGVIDCLIEDEEGLVLLDYKTDGIHGRFVNGFEGAKPVLADRYRLQLDMYARAVEQIWKKPLKEKYLYFFDGGHLLSM